MRTNQKEWRRKTQGSTAMQQGKRNSLDLGSESNSGRLKKNWGPFTGLKLSNSKLDDRGTCPLILRWIEESGNGVFNSVAEMP